MGTESLLDDARRIINSQEYAGTGIYLIEETYESYSDLYTVDENGKHSVNADLTIAQISPAIVNLYRDVNEALMKIEALLNNQQ